MAQTRKRKAGGARATATGGTTPLAGELRDGFKFRSGHLVLDLAATMTARKQSQPRDLLSTPADLDRWLRAAGLVIQGGGTRAADLESARALRESIYRLALARVRGRILPEADLELLNTWAAKPPPRLRLERDGRLSARGNTSHQLAALARAGAELLSGPRAEKIRECAGETCSILFLDASRAGERRWCSMASCGNRAKVATFRRRH